MTRSYSQLRRLETLDERFDYLALRGYVGDSTFGFDRWMNQEFYTSRQWRALRSHVIVRDGGCDLGIEGFEVHKGIVIHHMNPMTADDIKSGDSSILDPEYLISTTLRTHNAIHYGDKRSLLRPFAERSRNDTKLW